jgi:hypothetical protein
MLNSQFPAKTIGRKLLHEVATIVTPETLLAWHCIRVGNG